MRLYIVIASLETFLESHLLAVGHGGRGFCQPLSSLYFVSIGKIKILEFIARVDEIIYMRIRVNRKKATMCRDTESNI